MTVLRFRMLGFIAGLGVGLFPLYAVYAQSTVQTVPIPVTVDLGERRQIMEHFGASDCWSMQKIGAWSEPNKQRVAELLFSTTSGIGLSCWRFNLGAGLTPGRIGDWRTIETFETGEGVYDWSRQANERWFLRAAKAAGVPWFLAFANSPPARMTRNGFTNCTAGLGATNLKDGMEGAYARYLADILAHFRDNPDPAERIAFGYVSPVNEPHLPWNENSGQEGCRFDNRTIKNVVIALDAALKERGLSTGIRIPEANSYWALGQIDLGMTIGYKAEFGKYVDAFCGDPAINTLIGKTLCAHGYGSCTLDRTFLNNRRRARAALDKYPDWKVWQSEVCMMEGPKGESGGGRDLGMTTALWVARTIHYDLTLLETTAWHWWTAVSNVDFKDGLIYTDYTNPGTPETIYPAKLLWTLGNYSRFVRPGMVRVDVKGADDIEGLLGSAFVSPEEDQLVVVLINQTDAPMPVQLNLKSMPRRRQAGWFTPYITSDAPGMDLAPGPAVAADTPYTVPAKAVVTLVGALAKG